MKSRRPIPADFAEREKTMSQAQLLKHYGTGSGTLARWLKENGGSSRPGESRPRRPVPDNFAKYAHLPNAELREMYGCGRDLLATWRKKIGFKVDRKAIVAKASAARAVTFRNPMSASSLGSKFAAEDNRARGLAERAQGYLQSHQGGGWVVYRCNDVGRPDFSGNHWRCGTAVLTDDELIARAKRRGFDPLAWSRIAA